MTLQTLQRRARSGCTLVTLRTHLEEAASSAVAAGPPTISAKRPRLMPRRPARVAPAKRPGIHSWPVTERPREKLLERGAQALSDGELIALFVCAGSKGRSALDVARSLLAKFGSLRELLGADKQRWQDDDVRSFGPARYAQLMAALEISRRSRLEPLRQTPILATPADTRHFLLEQLRDRHYEVFCCLFLDNRHRLLGFEEIFRGTIDGANVYSREIVRQTLLYNAASVIVAHNHPSGSIEPSLADEGVTRRLRESLSLIQVRLVDHFVVGEGECYSFSEHGLL
jgi:DNA repair protein RadC